MQLTLTWLVLVTRWLMVVQIQHCCFFPTITGIASMTFFLGRHVLQYRHCLGDVVLVQLIQSPLPKGQCSLNVRLTCLSPLPRHLQFSRSHSWLIVSLWLLASPASECQCSSLVDYLWYRGCKSFDSLCIFFLVCFFGLFCFCLVLVILSIFVVVSLSLQSPVFLSF